MALDVGQRVGDYEILSLLGAGGMGRVYRVRNFISDRVEAMKVLLPDYASEPELAARFMAEIRTLATLEHPNIAQLRTAFQFENQFIMIMEFVEGATLESLARQGGVPIDQMLEYASQVLSALSYAHGRGVTHRDIKPANIMITAHGVVKLMDFGIAKSNADMQLTRPGTTMGSVYYMSPEQVRGDTVDARSDIYSFGVTLYEMLAGRRPFQADSSYSVLNAQLNEAPVPPIEVNPALSPTLNAIILTAMAKAPSDRFQSAEAFRNAIRNVQQQAQAATAATAEPPFVPVNVVAPAPAAKTHRGLWIGVGAATAVAALVAAALLVPRMHPIHASPAAQSASPTAPQPAPQPPATPDATPTPVGSSAAAEPTTPAMAAPAANPQADATPAAPSGAAPRHAPAAVQHHTTASSQSSEPLSGALPAQSPQPAAAPPPSGPSPAEVQQAQDRYASLDSRVGAAEHGVQSIRSQQQAQGLDLRGDVLASMNRLDYAMTSARSALNRNDLTGAALYMDRADKELATIEHFLGQ